MWTSLVPTKSIALLCAATIALAACDRPLRTPQTVAVSATDRAWCDTLFSMLPTRSRQDSEQTQAEIGDLYDYYERACQRPVP